MPVQFMILKDWFKVKSEGPKDLLTYYSNFCVKQIIIIKICLKFSSCINSSHLLYHVITYFPGYNITFCGTMKHSKPYRNLRVRGNRSLQDVNKIQNESPCEDGVHLHDLVPNKKLEKAVCSRLDSFSSCSSDSAFYCSSQCLDGDCMLSAQETLSKMVKVNDNYVKKRTRNSSGSSALSSASDSSNKGLQPLAMNGVLKHFIAPTKCVAENLPEITSTIARVKEVSSAASVMVSSVPTTTKSTIKTIVEEKTVSITCKSVKSSVPEPATFHNLRKRIRKKQCFNCNCGSNHTTVIVRRFTQIQRRTQMRQCSPQQKNKPKISSTPKDTLPLTCSQSVALPKKLRFKNAFSSANSKVNKRRRSEVDKLYDDLREIDWAKNFSRDNILSQCVDYRRPAASSLYSTSHKVSSTSRTALNTSLRTFQPVHNDFKDITKDLRESIVPHVKNLVGKQPHISEHNSITYPLLDNTKSLDIPLSSTVNGTGMFQCTFETTKVTNSNECINTLSVEKACNGICEKKLDESMSVHHDIAWSLLQSEMANDNVSSSYDSENSSFALDISPSISDDESIQDPEQLEVSSCHKWKNLNDPPAISKCAIEDSPPVEPFRDITALSLAVSNASLLPVESEDSIMIIAADVMKFAVESVLGKLSILENQSSESLLETILKEEKGNVSSCIDSEDNVESCGNMDKNESSESNSDLFNESFELPVLSITSPGAENFAADENPPSLEPYLHSAAEIKSLHCDIFHDDINKVEIVIPCSDSNLMELDSESSNKDIETDMEISDFDKQLKNSGSLKIPFSERLQHFKSLKNGKTPPIRKKILKKYFRQRRNKFKVNQMITPNMPSSLYANSDSSDENSNLSDANSDLSEANSDLSEANSDLSEANSGSSDANSDSSEARSDLSEANSDLSEVNSDLYDANSNSSDRNSVTDNSYQENSSTVLFSNQKGPRNERFQSKFVEGGSVTIFPRNRPHIFKNRPAQMIDMHNWSVPSSSTGYVKDSFVVNCVETQYSSVSNFNEIERTFNNIHKIGPANMMPITQPVVSLVNCSTMFNEAQKNSRFHIKNVPGTNCMQIIDVKSQESGRKVKNDVYNNRSVLFETLEKAKKLKTKEDPLVPFGVTFHYKCITVIRYDSFTKVILKLTRGQDIYLSTEALTELKDTVNYAKDDPSCKILILIGTDSCFCCGVDLQPLLGDGREEASNEMSLAIKKLVEALVAFEKPIVSVVNGKAVGFGVTLLTYTDIVLASDTASFTMRYGELGYFPEGAATLMLPRAIGIAKLFGDKNKKGMDGRWTFYKGSAIFCINVAVSQGFCYGGMYLPEEIFSQFIDQIQGMEMMLKGLKLTADEAKACNLVSEVVKASRLPYELVKRVKRLEENDLTAMEMTKSMLRMPYYHPLKACLEKEEQLLPKQWLSESCQKAMQIANEKGLL